MRSLALSTALLVGLMGACERAGAANWSIVASNMAELDTSSVGFAVSEMSGVTYVGPSPVVGRHRFLTVQDDGTGVVTFDAAFDLAGNLVSAEAVSELALPGNLDAEGIVAVGDTLWVSEENSPGVRQFDRTTGVQLQNVTVPAVFTTNKRNNRGFESLAYDAASSTLWTGNEEALTVDGALATSSAGTTVRLLELSVSGDIVTAGQQFAYDVQPIHGLAFGPARSGLAELVSLPDGTLIGLERSAAFASPLILHRVYEVDFAGATDVSEGALGAGLDGQTFASVGKELLWSGGINESENMEGLTVGPRLPSGDWILLGVVDNGGSGNNTIATFTASPTTPIAFAADSADFDEDGRVDGDDLLAWQRGRGVATLAGLTHGDANHDGTVTAADLTVWQSQYGTATVVASTAIPEPAALTIGLVSATCSVLIRRHVIA